MSVPRSKGLHALQRWRSFGEDRAALARQLALRVVAEATAAVATVQDRAQAASEQRRGLLQSPLLDLARLTASAGMEDAAWRDVQVCQQRLQHAEDDAQVAREQHETAHRMARAVAHRATRVVAIERDAAEKHVFDSLVELRGRLRGGPHD
ncbi:hypothetical protein [uncultured Stenotrophomonas sp.]|uniref:hypothetical protein n=1 Tax=uncultured Stenotrophomonas sp. TaxID=165438 RepID=UPI0025EF2AA2|nr:hypothetical protein [uncultured Stenotrophomonas sp.]